MTNPTPNRPSSAVDELAAHIAHFVSPSSDDNAISEALVPYEIAKRIISAQEQRLAYTQQERDKNELMSIQMCAERDAALEKIEAQEQRLGELEARNKIYLKSIYDAEEAAEAAGRPEGEYLAHSIEYFVSQWQQTQAKVEQFIRIYQEQDHTNQHD